MGNDGDRTMIRDAGPADIPGILAVWNPFVRDTTVTFAAVEKTPQSVADLMAERLAQGYCFLVAEDAGQITGFATYAPFRGGEGYARTMEHSIMLAPEARGRGHGRALMARLEAHAFARGGHTIFAVVSGENAAGIAFHAAVGYVTVAVLPEAGWKFGRWLDAVLMQKKLGNRC